MLENLYEGLNARSEIYQNCLSSKLCEFIKMLLSAARLLCGDLRQQIQKCYWSQIQMMYKEKSFSTMTDSRALHLLKMAFMLLLHAVKSQIM